MYVMRIIVKSNNVQSFIQMKYARYQPSCSHPVICSLFDFHRFHCFIAKIPILIKTICREFQYEKKNNNNNNVNNKRNYMLEKLCFKLMQIYFSHF